MYDITAKCTNDADFILSFLVTDENDDTQDISDYEFEFVLNDKDGVGLWDENTTGVSVTKDLDESIVSIIILESALRGLDCGIYRIACRAVGGEDHTIQLFKGRLVVEEGEFNQ